MKPDYDSAGGVIIWGLVMLAMALVVMLVW